MKITKTATKGLPAILLLYVEQNATEELAEKINRGAKTFEGCAAFVKGEARKQAQNGVAVIEDATVYGWAMHFFEEDEIPEPDEKAKTAASVGVTTKSAQTAEQKPKQQQAPREKAQKAPKPKKDDGYEQLDIFGGMI